MGNKTKIMRGSISYVRLYESLSESDKKLIDVRLFKELFVNHIHKIKTKADYTDSLNNSILRWIDLYDNFITYIKDVFDKFDDGKLFHFEVSYSADGKAEDINISYRFKYTPESTKLIYARSLNIERTVIFNFDLFYFIDGFMHIMLPNNDTSVIYLDGNIHEILVCDISYILSEVEFIAFMQEALRAYVTNINCMGKINLVGIPDSLIEKCGKINAFYKEKHEAYEKALSANIKENGSNCNSVEKEKQKMCKVIKLSRMCISYYELYTYLSESDKKLIDIQTFKEIFINHISKIKAKADCTDMFRNNILNWIDLYDDHITIIKGEGVFDKFDDGKLFHFEVSYYADGMMPKIHITYRFKYSSVFKKLLYGRSFTIDDRFKVDSTFNPSCIIFGLMNTLLPNNAVSVIELDGSIHEILVSDISYILSEAEFIELMNEIFFVYVNTVNHLGRINLAVIPDSLTEKCKKINDFYKDKHEAYEKALSANIKENGGVEKKKDTDEKDIKKLYDNYCTLTKMQFTLDENGDIRVIFNPSLGENKAKNDSPAIPKCEYIMEGHKITHRPHIVYYRERFLSISQDPQFKLTWGKVAYDDFKRELIRAVMQSSYRLDDLVITDDFVAFNTLPYLHIYVGAHFDGLGPVVRLYADQKNIGYETNDYYEYYFNAMVIVNDMLLNKGLKIAPRAKYFNRKVLEQVVKLGFTTTEQIVPNYMHAHRIISTQPTIKISIDNPDKYVPVVKRNITVK